MIFFRFELSLFKEIIKANDISAFHQNKTGKIHKELALELRKKVSYHYKQKMIVEEENFFPKPSYHPIIFEEIFIKDYKENQMCIPHKPLVFEFSK